MRKLVLAVLLLAGAFTPFSQAQTERTQVREAEWKNLSVPKTTFVRHLGPDKRFIVRVPSEWKQVGDQMTFNGPHSSVMRIMVEKIPDGLPLADYVTAVIKTIDGVLGANVSSIARRTQFQDLEAREIVFESPNAEGDLIHTTTWLTVVGPLAAAFSFQAPVNNSAELEPYFKGLVQSVMFVKDSEIEEFEKRREVIPNKDPGPIDELQLLTSQFNEPSVSREPAVERLTAILKTNPDVVIDLLMDRRLFIRAAAVEALARHNTPGFEEFLWEAVDDPEPLVAAPAARRLASTVDLLKKLMVHSLSGLNFQVVARVWPYMLTEKRVELLQTVFSQTAVRLTTSAPPPVRRLKPGVGVTVTELIAIAPGKEKEMLSLRNGPVSNDPYVQICVLTLLGDVTPAEFKLPLQRILAADYDPLTVVGLQVALNRSEQLPVDQLLKLAASTNDQLRSLALDNLALSASVSDISRIESLATKNSKPRKPGNKLPTESKTDLEFNLTIKKIRLRDRIEIAKRSNQSATEIIKEAMSDPTLADFAWSYSPDAANMYSPTFDHANLKSDITVQPFAQNLFPRQLTHFVAIPKPGQAVEKFYQSLKGIQMESPKAQSGLVLAMGGVRQILGQQLGAPPEATSLIDYTGIKSDSPIALAAWTNDEAAIGVSAARQKAIILRINNRERFERAVEIFQKNAGDFTSLTDYLAVATRGIAALPALLPFSAKAVLSNTPSKITADSKFRSSVVSQIRVMDLPVTVIQHKRLDSDWRFSGSTTYLIFLGDVVLVSSNLGTLREMLTRANSDSSEQLAVNQDFREATATDGDVIYFSDIDRVIGGRGADASNRVKESGALTLSGASWENSHHFAFKESNWSQYLGTFHPKELAAPRELLPASTIAYFFMKANVAEIWQNWSKELVNKGTLESLKKVWLPDFEREVAPELGDECGIAMMDLPDLDEFHQFTWAAFCKLKTTKLSDLLVNGKLLRDVAATNDFAEIKLDKTSHYISSRKGFLIISNTKEGITSLAQNKNLASTRDYSKAVERVPEGVVAFGGYNLEAAIAAAGNPSAEDLKIQIANMVFSLASAFHSQNFYATATAGSVHAKSSVAMDREGRYGVAELNYLPRATNITFATLEPSGVPILDQNRISNLVVRIKSKAPGPIENIRDEIKLPGQVVEQKSATELVVNVAARRAETDQKIQLPVSDASLTPFLKSTHEFSADNPDVINRAREIAGKDRDAWSVAQKLADWTYKNLTWKATAVANASQTLATREADCTEFSQLYVSMARSLGLPARMVSGLAFSGSSFGGHAWVEVWIGRWVELDPTWGTDFVDATHIRNTSSALVTSAALNFIELEVLEAKRRVAEFQTSPSALANELTNALGSRRQSSFEASVDIEMLTDKLMGPGEWVRMSNDERNQMSLGYRRILLQLYFENRTDDELDELLNGYRVIHVTEKGDQAEALCLSQSDELFKFFLEKGQNSWHLVEIVNTDTGFHVISESLKPAIQAIKATRAGQKPKVILGSDFVRAQLLSQSNPKKAIEFLDRALKEDPTNQDLMFLKASAFISAEQREDGLKLLTQLSSSQPAYAPAIYSLASWLRGSENEEEKKSALDLYKRYVALEPNDPRAHEMLGILYSERKDLALAEVELKRAVELDPDDSGRYVTLLEFLIQNDLNDQIGPVLDSAKKHPKVGDEDLLGYMMEHFYFEEEIDLAEKLAANQPARMKTSAVANLNFAHARMDDGRPLEAIPLLNLAIQLDKQSVGALLALAEANRALSRWSAALKAADNAVGLEPESGATHYERACALARLGRTAEAMKALNKSIEIDSFRLLYIGEEKDLKPLSSVPAFKKLLAEAEKKDKESPRQ